MVTEAGNRNRAHLEEYPSDRREDSERSALSEEQIDTAFQTSRSGRDRVRGVLDGAQRHAEGLSEVVPGIVDLDRPQLPDPTE